MNRMRPEYPDPDLSDHSATEDVLVRKEPDEDDDEDDEEEEDADDREDYDEGYSE